MNRLAIVCASGLALGIFAAQSQAMTGPPVAGKSASAPTKLWVYFKDKGFTSPEAEQAAIRGLKDSYDPHAVARRAARRSLPGLFDQSDLPVAASYTDAVARIGVRLHVQSKWLNAVSVYATPKQAAALKTLPFVRGIEPVRGGRRPEVPGASERPETTVQQPPSDDDYGLAHDQLDQIQLIAVHNLGFTGSGMRIGILDTGFKRSHIAFHHPSHPLQVIAEHDFVKNDGNTAPEAGDDPDQHTHGTMILGTLGAYIPGTLLGAAYDASFILCKTEDVPTETPVEEDNYVGGLEFIESHGGDVATASLVYSDWYTYSQFNGLTAPTTIAVNLATSNGMYCCNAVGNSGHDSDPLIGHIAGVPADAFKVLSIGAVDSGGAIAGFSSDGPTADGRLKPEILARGVSTFSVSPSDDSGYVTASGTSLSTPLAAGAVTCLAQARPWWSVDKMRARLMNTAGDFVAFGHPDPLMVRGYGILNALAALDCYSNCDDSTATPTLTANDFQCFLNSFSAASIYSNCDRSSTVPVLTANDFQCFLNAFAAGCS